MFPHDPIIAASALWSPVGAPALMVDMTPLRNEAPEILVGRRARFVRNTREMNQAVLKINLYLNVDGVLIAGRVGRRPEGVESLWPGGYVVAHPYVWTQVSPAMIEALNVLIARHSIAGCWTTSWERKAPAFGEQTGLTGSGEWPVLEVNEPVWTEWSKAAAVRNHIAATGPDAAVWIDDHLGVQPEAREWAEASGILTIAPDPVHGIEPRHLEAIEQYVAGLRRLTQPKG
ncbi:HAD domain-containing protein [Sinomonas sp. RB5]